jgi:hypothetical protein
MRLTNENTAIFDVINLHLLAAIQDDKFTVFTIDDIEHLSTDGPWVLDEGFYCVFHVMKGVVCQPDHVT